jgi:hypothetical protein
VRRRLAQFLGRIGRNVRATPEPFVNLLQRVVSTSAFPSRGDDLMKGNPLIACAHGVKDALMAAAAFEGVTI